MKKIVGILAAAAVAASAFAADVSAATKLSGSLFSYNADKTFGMFTERNDSHDYAQPNMTFSVSDDRVGATVKLTTNNYGGDSNGVVLTTQTIWFKPFDVLKVTVGNFDVALNKETIDYTESKTALGGNGFLASVNVEGFGLDLGLSGHEGNWFEKKDGVDPVLRQFFVKAGYSADFGNIGAFVSFNDDEKDSSGNNLIYNATSKATGAIKRIKFGAGYAKNFDGINMFVNVVGYMGDKFDWVRPEVFVNGSVEDFGFAVFAAPVIFTNSDLNYKTQLEVVAKLTYKIDAVTAYAYFKDGNIMNDKFVSTIKLGAQGSIGAMGWNIWAQIDTNSLNTAKTDTATAFSLPFELTFAF